MNQYHYLQLEILKHLLFVKDASYTELKSEKRIENSKHTFHLNQLIKDGYVEKINNRYSLTDKGKEYANTLDTDKTKVIKQGKIGIIHCPARKIDDEWEFLIYTRLKHPNFGKQGFGSGKVFWGEMTKDTAIRELKEETNLEGNGQLFKIRHILVFSKGNLVEDKYLYFYRFINPVGELKCNNEGTFEWVKYSKLKKYLKNPFENIDIMFEHVENIINLKTPLIYTEVKDEVEGF